MIKKKITTADKIEAREKRKKETVHIENNTIENLSKRPVTKDKAISLRINGTNYLKLKKICSSRGFSVNSCINMLVSDFIKDNSNFLDDN